MPVFMKELYCGHCGCPSRHLVSTLAEMLGGELSVSSKDEDVPYACPECGHLSLGRLVHLQLLTDLNPDKYRDSVAEFLIALECDNKFCRSRVPVVAPMNAGTDVAQAMQQVQYWQELGLRCTNGHQLFKPLQIGGIRKF